MDLTKLDLGPKATSRTETAIMIEPMVDGEPIPLKGGKNLAFTMVLPNTPEGQREVRKWALRYGRKDRDPAGMSEEELDALVSHEMDGETELAARLVREWNLIDKAGQTVECSFDNRKAFFAHFHAIRTDAVMQMHARVSDLGNLPNA